MAKFVKKKINVGLLIVFLMCAFVPGIIYLIYCAIPAKIPTEKPKYNGGLLRIIGSGVALLFYVICILYFNAEELAAAFIYIGTGSAALMLLMSVLNIKTNSIGLLMTSIFITLLYIAISVLFSIFIGVVFYLWIEIPILAAGIAVLVGISFGTKYINYNKYCNEEIPAEAENE